MRRRPRQAHRGGFLIVSVLVLLMIVVIMTAVMLRSSTARHAVVQRQINGYQDHHDMLSVRHVALRWMSRGRGLEALEEIAGDPRLGADPPLVYAADLPDGLAIRLTVERGQGLLQRDLEGAESPKQRELIQRTLDVLALSDDSDGLTRNIGPVRLVLSTVPDELIEALGSGNQAIVSALLAAKREGQDSPGEIQRTLEEFGVAQQQAITLASELFTNQTRMWKLTAYTERESNRRRIALYMMQEGDSSFRTWKILDARVLPPEPDIAG